MKTLIHKILYKTLPLEGYLRAVSRMFFLWQRLGIGRYAPATEYVYHLPQLVHAGDTAIDIGANLGYYARTLSRQAGGTEDKAVTMANDSARATGYFGTGQNFVNDGGTSAAAEFPARMRRGSELFAGLERLDFIKCDIEGYEVVVMNELRPLLERFRPTVLIETGGENRPQIVALFTTLGYAGFTLDRGREIPLTPDTTKDIIFRHAH